ncbi:hemolysin [Candidatus Liberibacter solanacearum]|uniref:L-proline glycine betaine ABC transport system permease protein ProV n=1 Tax=Candidatus Liberibacter solanacearum TaxID=556287 RepID=A0A094Z1C7_9HYPH|nr:ATP-binding cassette domain-containing protein [Candidatus Liberibacter solanacearum]KGB27432.1 hemolysin [Candidatus Liberibacter solanacearum]KJZ81149.1 hemolysin [Candidatus Liberibacter solanacearum]KJZ82366.1 L-proline glycine betaine ABC transport system permease protein ProV [Candidatus Liberibacter solanacearum]KQC49242.1 hemolysin [Candidatus Liberibacter solanacearum]
MNDCAVKFRDVDIVFGESSKKIRKRFKCSIKKEDEDSTYRIVSAVTKANLGVKKGEILVLMGLSGAGKSTLLRSINGLAPVVRGEVLVDTDKGFVNPYSADASVLRKLRMHTVSMVFQQFALLPWRTVARNVELGLEFLDISDVERKSRVAEQLEIVNLSKWADCKINMLSGGMKQRVGFARAFATGAPILLMDEPFSSLDPLIRMRLQDELLALQKQLKKTIVFVSHDINEAFRLGNRIAIMEGGRIIQCGTPQEIILHPANGYVSEFVQKLNPITTLVASDIMRSFSEGDESDIVNKVPNQMSLVDIIDMVADNSGKIGVVADGKIIGVITAMEIIKGLACCRKCTDNGSF